MWKEKNPLLTRDDVGKAKPSTHDLPMDQHAYGVPNKKEEFGVGKLTTSWHLPELRTQKPSERDYQKLNKMGINAKIIKPYQVREFRMNHEDVRRVKKNSQPGRVHSLRQFETAPVDPDPTKAASI